MNWPFCKTKIQLPHHIILANLTILLPYNDLVKVFLLIVVGCPWQWSCDCLVCVKPILSLHLHDTLVENCFLSFGYISKINYLQLLMQHSTFCYHDSTILMSEVAAPFRVSCLICICVGAFYCIWNNRNYCSPQTYAIFTCFHILCHCSLQTRLVILCKELTNE